MNELPEIQGVKYTITIYTKNNLLLKVIHDRIADLVRICYKLALGIEIMKENIF